MTRDKGNIFGNKDTKITQDHNTDNENKIINDSGESSEIMSEPNGILTDEMLEEKSSGNEPKSGEAVETEEKDINAGNQFDMKKQSELQQKVDELQDKYVRLMAEFDNFRRRTTREKMEIIKSAGEDVLISLLPVIDDFDRGLQVMEQSPDVDAVKEGILLIYNKFKDFLVQRGVKEIDSVNQDFNVELHEALTKTPAPKEELKGKVLDVIQKGYYLNDKVIRYAKVIVGE